MPSIDIYKNTKSAQNIDSQIMNDSRTPGVNVEAGFLERLSTSFQTQSRLTEYGNKDLLAEAAESQLSLISDLAPAEEANLGTAAAGLDAVGDLLSSRGGGIIPAKSSQEDTIDQLRTKNEEIERLKELHPEAGLKTVDELQQDLGKEYAELQQKDMQETEDSTFLGKIGFAVGAIGGYFLSDPINLASIAAPGGVIKAGKPLQSAINVATVEAGIDAALFVKDRPTEETVREAAGEEITTADTIKEFFISIGTAIGIAAPIGALLGKLSKGSAIGTPSAQAVPSDLPTKATKDNPVTAGFAEKVTKLDEAALTAKVDENVLTSGTDIVDMARTTPRELSQVEHAVNMDKAYKDFLKGDNIEVPVQKGTEPVLEEIAEEIEVPSDTVDVVDIQARTIEDSRKSLGIEDVEIEIEEGIKVSAKDRLIELEDDMRAIDEISKCHAKGGPNAV